MRRSRRRDRFLVVEWQGAPLAFAQLEDLLEDIQKSLQPPRADIIDKAVRTALKVVALLENFWESMPPGTAPFVRATERRALSGWPGAVSPLTRAEIEEEEEEAEERRRRRRDRRRRRLGLQPLDDDDDDDRRDEDEDEDEDEEEDAEERRRRLRRERRRRLEAREDD